jgi:hypothetical protein
MLVTAFYKIEVTNKNEVKILINLEIYFVYSTSHHRIVYSKNARPFHQDWISILVPI